MQMVPAFHGKFCCRFSRDLVLMHVKITTPRFKAQLVITGGVVTNADLILSWAVGWKPSQLRDYVIRKGWSVRAWT
jgi:hypothetical protein